MKAVDRSVSGSYRHDVDFLLDSSVRVEWDPFMFSS